MSVRENLRRVEVDGVERHLIMYRYSSHDGVSVNCARKHIPFVVVRMFADEVGSSRSSGCFDSFLVGLCDLV